MARTVLIVDDAAYMRMVLKDILVKAGYEVVAEAQDAKAAFEAYAKHKPDLVTMDIVMLGMTGIEAVKRIVKQDPKAKVMMVSALGQQSLIVDAIQSGAKGFVIKPFTPEAVLDEAKRIIG